jgi:hypothetical protein
MTDTLDRQRDDRPAVLVIEDDFDNQNVYEIILQDRYEVLLAATTRTCERIFERSTVVLSPF